MHKLFGFLTDFLQWPSKVAYCKTTCRDEAQFLISGLGGRQKSKNTLFFTFWVFFAYNTVVHQHIFFMDINQVSNCEACRGSLLLYYLLYWLKGGPSPTSGRCLMIHWAFSRTNSAFLYRWQLCSATRGSSYSTHWVVMGVCYLAGPHTCQFWGW